MGNAVLVVHSDHLPRELARQALESAGHTVAEAADVLSSVRVAQAAQPDLLLIEWTEHRLLRDALDRLRGEPATSQSRVVVWADHADIHDAISALEFGVDDCLPIPFDRVELIARINACLRRSVAGARPDQLAAGPLVLAVTSFCVARGRVAIKAGHRTVDVHVRRLREHLEPFGLDEMIATVRGFGYRFGEPGRVRNGRIQRPMKEAEASARPRSR